MKKTSTKLFFAILFLAGTISAFALDIKGSAPQFTGTYATTFQTEVNKAFNTALGELQDMAGDIDSKPEDFIQSWGNSAVFASHGATQRAYGEYKLFSFTLGPMIGIQLPGDPFSIMNDLDNLTQKLNDDRDIKLGISPQVFNARLGINTSKFLLDKLYLGLHIGFMKLDGNDFGLDGFSFNNFSLGVTANYQLIPQKKLAAGLLLWRGVNVGSGLIYQGTKIGYTIEMERIEQSMGSVSGITGTQTLTLDPKMILDMNINTVTIPLEATTAVKLLWFLNIPLGVGADLAFGKSDMKVGMTGDVNAKNLPSGVTQSAPGSLSVDAGGDMAPSFFNLKLMTGIGLNFGPVVIDIPVTFYLGNGYSIGLTIGAVW